jgi:hypothetical protein
MMLTVLCRQGNTRKKEEVTINLGVYKLGGLPGIVGRTNFDSVFNPFSSVVFYPP